MTLSAELKAKKPYVLVPCWDSEGDQSLTGEYTLKTNGAKVGSLPPLAGKEVKVLLSYFALEHWFFS